MLEDILTTEKKEAGMSIEKAADRILKEITSLSSQVEPRQSTIDALQFGQVASQVEPEVGEGNMNVLLNVLVTALHKKLKLVVEHGDRVSPTVHIQLHKDEVESVIKILSHPQPIISEEEIKLTCTYPIKEGQVCRNSCTSPNICPYYKAAKLGNETPPKEGIGEAIIDLLDNLLYWDTCPQHYKDEIPSYKAAIKHLKQ